MGGCLYGAWWHFPLVRTALTIPVLEMLAACVNFVIFVGQLEQARQVVMEIDALASPNALHKDKARAPGLRAVLAEFRALPQLQAFTRRNALFCQHCYGEATRSATPPAASTSVCSSPSEGGWACTCAGCTSGRRR